MDLDSDWLDDLVENSPEDNFVDDIPKGFSGNIAFIGDHDINTDTYRVDILASAKEVDESILDEGMRVSVFGNVSTEGNESKEK